MKSTKSPGKVRVRDLKARKTKTVKGGLNFTKNVDKASPVLF